MTQFPVEIERVYYKNTSKLEESLDIYRPTLFNNDDNNNERNNVLIVLVVGNAWVGHTPLIYIPSSWWNAPGPTTIAKYLGYTCVFIRHRGAFPNFQPFLFFTSKDIPQRETRKQYDTKSSSITPIFSSSSSSVSATITTRSWLYWFLVSATIGVSGMVLSTSITSGVVINSQSPYETVSSFIIISIVPFLGTTTSIGSIVFLLFITSFLCFKYWIEYNAINSVSFDDMLDDVCTALQWIQTNKKKIIEGRNKTSTSSSNGTRISSLDRGPKMVLGGYSSGAHVVASLLQHHPDTMKQKCNLTLDEICNACLYISGVFATRPIEIEKGNDKKLLCNDRLQHSTPKQPPVWFVNFLLYTVFGWKQDGRTTIPSPAHDYSLSPHVPHLFIGCENEVSCGITLLDQFFASSYFASQLQKDRPDIPSKYIPVKNTDHWYILSSIGFRQALLEHLPKLIQQIHNYKYS